MVIYELLGHQDPASETRPAEELAKTPMTAAAGPSEVRQPGSIHPASARRPRSPPKPQAPTGSVKTFVHDRLFPANGERLDMKALTADYRAWCSLKGALELARFLDEIETVCRRAGISIEIGADNKVYCMDVKLEHCSRTDTRSFRQGAQALWPS